MCVWKGQGLVGGARQAAHWEILEYFCCIINSQFFQNGLHCALFPARVSLFDGFGFLFWQPGERGKEMTTTEFAKAQVVFCCIFGFSIFFLCFSLISSLCVRFEGVGFVRGMPCLAGIDRNGLKKGMRGGFFRFLFSGFSCLPQTTQIVSCQFPCFYVASLVLCVSGFQHDGR